MDLIDVITPEGPDYAWLKQMDYRLCESVEQFRDYLRPAIEAKQPIGCDWETTSLNFFNKTLHIVGLSVSVGPGTGIYVPILHTTGAEHNLPLVPIVDVLREADGAGCPLPWDGWKFDGNVARLCAQWEPEHWECVLTAVYLEDSNQKQFGLKYTAHRLLGLTMLEYDDVTGGKNFRQLHPRQAVAYACADADLARRIWLLPKVQHAVKDQSLIYTLEKRLLPVIRDGIAAGVYIDAARLQRMRDEIGAEVKAKNGKVLVPASRTVKELRDKIFELAGGPFEIDSPQKLGRKLVELGVDITEKTDSETNPQVATGKDVLAKYATKHPICKLVVQYRELNTQCRNYIDKLLAACQHFGALVRFSFNPIGAPTGRMSAGGDGKHKGESFEKGFVNLNVQSMPDHEKRLDDDGNPYLPNIRAAFVANDPRIVEAYDRFCVEYGKDVVEQALTEQNALFTTYMQALRATGADPDEGLRGDEWVWVSIDYSQIEMRVAANLSREPVWIDSFAKGKDFHETNAELAYGDPDIVKKDKSARKRGKTMGFAVLFQASDETVAAHGGIPVAMAKKLIKTFYENAPTLGKWIEGMKAAAKANKYVKTYFGRLRRLEEYYRPDAPRWLVEKGGREAVNSPVQGGAADVFKIACRNVWVTVNARGWQRDVKQILWLHDELNFRVRRSMAAEVVPVLVKEMEFEIRGWPVAIVADPEIGLNWGELVKFQKWVSGQDSLKPAA